MTHSARLTRQARAFDGGDDFILCAPIGFDQRLGDNLTQYWPCKVLLLIFAIDRDLTRAWLDPDSGNCRFAATGAVRATLLVNLGFRRDGRELCGRAFTFGDVFQVFEGLCCFSQLYATFVFLVFMEAKSTASGDWASWGCSAPA